MFFKMAIILGTLSISMLISAEASVVQEAQSKMKTLQETTNTALSTAFSAYSSLSQPLDSFSLTAKANNTEVIQSNAEKYRQDYEAIKEAALEAGINITVCTGYIEAHINNLGPDYTNMLNECVDGVLSSALEYLQPLIVENVNQAWSVLFEDERELVKCGSFDEVCLNYLIAQIERDVHYVRQNVAALVSDFLTVYQLYHSKIFDLCVNMYVPVAIGRGQSLVDNFQQCVDSFSDNNKAES